jgi:hypothetical protein
MDVHVNLLDYRYLHYKLYSYAYQTRDIIQYNQTNTSIVFIYSFLQHPVPYLPARTTLSVVNVG